MITITAILETISQILTAGVAITAIALLMYTLGFSFRDRLVQTFVLILLCVMVVYVSETIAGISRTPLLIDFWLRVKWAGLVMWPAVFFHFSDTLLTLTGKPSRGRRRWLVRIIYALAVVGIALIPFKITIGELAPSQQPSPYLTRTGVTFLIGILYLVVMVLASYNLLRAISRSVTPTGKRRLMYLFAGAAAPAFTSLLFLFHGSRFFSTFPDLFWLISILGAILTGVFLVLMTYAVSFFGVPWTDRAIKSRLFRWLMRGPFVAAVVLGLTAIVRRYGETLGDPYIAYVPIAMVGSILLLEYSITLLAPRLEKSLFFGDDRENLAAIRSLEERLLTKKDLVQFLEVISSSICDRLQVSVCFIAVMNGNKVDQVIHTGDVDVLANLPSTEELIQKALENGSEPRFMFVWGEMYLVPLEYVFDNQKTALLGLCGFPKPQNQELDQEDLNAVRFLTERAALALKDRALQDQVLESLSALQSEVDYIQSLRAKSAYDRQGIYLNGRPEVTQEFTDWVKDALTHYWGGPKLTNNPLLDLKIVEEASAQHEGNKTNALRAILKEAIEKTKPAGERRFTGDWLLYNILDLKFLQGKKVRDVAQRLAVSEADLYRKQRVALENVAQFIIEMERDGNHAETQPVSEQTKSTTSD